MSEYAIGSFISLEHLNKKAEVSTVRPKSVFKGYFEVSEGTSYVFEKTADGLRASLKIPVQVIA